MRKVREGLLLVLLLAAASWWGRPVSVPPTPPLPEATPTPQTHVWPESWEDEMVFISSPHWAYRNTLRIERDHFTCHYSGCMGSHLVDEGVVQEVRGQRITLRGRKGRQLVLNRSGQGELQTTNAALDLGVPYVQVKYSEPHLRPSADWLKPGGQLTIHGVALGMSLEQVRSLHRGSVQKLGQHKLQLLMAKDPGFSVRVSEDGHIIGIYGLGLEQDGRTLLNLRSTCADVQALNPAETFSGRGLAYQASGDRLERISLEPAPSGQAGATGSENS